MIRYRSEPGFRAEQMVTDRGFPDVGKTEKSMFDDSQWKLEASLLADEYNDHIQPLNPALRV